MNVTWRELTDKIINAEEFLTGMLYQAIYVPPGAEPASQDVVAEPELARYVKGWGREGDFALVAEVEGEPIGAIWCRLFTKEDSGFGFVAEDIPELAMAVLPESRGQGVGRQLLRQFLLRSFFKRKILRISLSVDQTNFAKKMYESAGFKEVKRDGDSVVLLWSAEETMN